MIKPDGFPDFFYHTFESTCKNKGADGTARARALRVVPAFNKVILTIFLACWISSVRPSKDCVPALCFSCEKHIQVIVPTKSGSQNCKHMGPEGDGGPDTGKTQVAISFLRDTVTDPPTHTHCLLEGGPFDPF